MFRDDLGRSKGLLSFFCGCFVTCAVLQAAGSTQPARLDAIIRELKSAERKLLNIVVESELWEEECDANSDRWRRTPICYAGTAWYNGLPGSIGRIDVRREVHKWTGGPAPYAEDSYSVGFDGKTAWTAEHATGPLDKSFTTRGGRISPEVAGMVFNKLRGYQTGAGFTAFLWNIAEKQSLGDFLTNVTGNSMRFPPIVSVSDENLDGTPCVRIEVSGPKYVYRFWLDPRRGYSLLRHYFDNHTALSGAEYLYLFWFNSRQSYALLKHYFEKQPSDQTWIIADDRVTQLVEATPGIWYPTEATHLHNSLRTGIKTRWHYRAKKVTANSPDFDKRIFGPDFPVGYTVEDKVAGTVYQVAPPKEKLEAELNRIVQEVAATTQKSPDDELAPANSAAVAEQSKRGSALPVVIFAVVAVIAVGCAAIILYRRQRSAKIATGIAILLSMAGVAGSSGLT